VTKQLLPGLAKTRSRRELDDYQLALEAPVKTLSEWH